MEEKIIEGGVNNIDYEVDEELYQQQLLKTSTPMYLKRITPVKKQINIEEHKIKDVISKNEKKTSNFIQKHNQNLEQKGFAEGETPNKLCNFGITAVGMNQDLLNCIESNQKLIDTVEMNDYIVDNELYLQLNKFKKDLVEKAESMKLKKLLDHYIYSFGTKEGQANLFLIKRIPKKYSYFERIKSENNDNNENNNNEEGVENKIEENEIKIENKDKEKLKVQDNREPEIKEGNNNSIQHNEIDKDELKKKNQIWIKKKNRKKMNRKKD
jgi:hypothetical protein